MINDERPEIIIIIDNLDGELGDQFREAVEGTDSNIKIIEFRKFVKIKESESIDTKEKYALLFDQLIINSITNSVMDSVKQRTFRKIGQVTTQRRYFVPILESLIEARGEDNVKNIYNAVEQKMKNTLVDKDYENLPSGDIRWRNAVRFARQSMIDRGLLDKNSPAGIWKITDKGRDFYNENRER